MAEGDEPKNPYNPITQSQQWRDWQLEHAGGGNATQKPAADTKPPAPVAPGKPSLPGTTPTPTQTTYTPKPPQDFAAKNIADRKAALLATGNYKETLPAGYTLLPGGNKALGPNGTAMQKDNQTNLWSPTFATKADTQNLIASRQQGNVGATPTAATTASNDQLRDNIAVSAGAPRANAGLAGLPGTVGKTEGITVPGFERFNQPGLGMPTEGRTTLHDRGELNDLWANKANGPQIQFGPGARNGRAGNAIVFGNARDGGGYEARIDPQTHFGDVSVNVPNTYVKGAGNINDANRAFEVPFNIGQGGASLMNIGGSNVQLNSPDKGTGSGFALTPGTPSDRFAATDFGAATGRDLSNDPALNAAQTLSLIAAMNQGASVGQLTEASRGQYSGNPASTVQNNGTWFSGAAPGPQDTLAQLVDQRDKDQADGGGGREFVSYAKGGRMMVMLPRRAQGHRPLAFADGGTITSPGLKPDANPYTVGGPGVTDPTSSTSVTIDPGGQVPAPTNTTNPPADFDPTNTKLLDPYVNAQLQDASLNRARDAEAYKWQAGGTARPTAIEVPLGYEGSATAPGTYLSRTRALNDAINGIETNQAKLTSMGPNEDYNDVTAKIAALKQAQAPYKTAMGYQTQLQGLGTTQDLGTVNAQIADVKQQMGPLGTIVDASQKLTALGPKQDPSAYTGQIAQYEKDLENAQAMLPEVYKNPYAYPEGAANYYMGLIQDAQNKLPQLKSALSTILSHNTSIDEATTARDNLLAASGLTMDQVNQQTGAYQTQLDALKTALGNAQQAADLKAQITALVGEGVDPTAKYGDYASQIDPLDTQASGILGRNAQRQDISRAIYQLTRPGSLPGFKNGGWIKAATSNAHGQFAAKAKAAGMSTRAYAAAHAGDSGKTGQQARLAKTLMGFKNGGSVKMLPDGKKKSMVTPERITGVGDSGKVYFEVGEPVKPGGPDMKERLTFPTRSKMKITPLHKPALPLGRRRAA